MSNAAVKTKRIRDTRSVAAAISLESIVDTVAVVGFCFGILVSFWAVILARFAIAGILASIGIAWVSFTEWLLLRCLAEHLRLQKKIAGLPYSGDISGTPQLVITERCGNCGYTTYSATRCDHCGAEFTSEEAATNIAPTTGST